MILSISAEESSHSVKMGNTTDIIEKPLKHHEH